MIRDAFEMLQDDTAYIPLHQQALAWGFGNRVNLVQLPDNFMRFMWVSDRGR